MTDNDMQCLAKLSDEIDDEFTKYRPLRPEFRRLTRDTGLVITRDLQSGIDAFMLVVNEIHLKHVHGEPLSTAHLEILKKMKDCFQDAKANAGICKKRLGPLQGKVSSCYVSTNDNPLPNVSLFSDCIVFERGILDKRQFVENPVGNASQASSQRWQVVPSAKGRG